MRSKPENVTVSYGWLLAAVLAGPLARGQEGIVGWGAQVFDSRLHHETFVQVAAGWSHTAARRADGSLAAWGKNEHGECQVPALPPGTTYVDVACGIGFTLARRSDGSMVAWGDNQSGQCNVPALPPGATYTRCSASDHAAAVRNDGSLVAWGDNSLGQCNVPALPPALTYVGVCTGYQFTLALRSDGSVVGWGANDVGQCNAPALPASLAYVDMAAGYSHVLARRSDGRVVAWGTNGLGACNIPAFPSGLTGVHVAAGWQSSLVLLSNGSLIAWGFNLQGQVTVPVLPPGTTWVDVSSGFHHAVGLRSDGKAVAWGENISCQCNVPALSIGVSYVAAAAGWRHTLALASDGSVVAWGLDDNHQCLVPQLPPGLTYVEVAAGDSISLARRNDGSAVDWGATGLVRGPLPAGNYIGIADGMSGSILLRSDGNVTAISTNGTPPWTGVPYVQVAGGPDPTSGGDVWAARRSDGSVVIFGPHSPGPAPSLPPGVVYVDVAAGEQFAMATRSDGVTLAWGSNAANQLLLPQLSPGQVLTHLTAYRDRCVAIVDTGSYSTFADGCPGSAGTTRLAAAAPRLGSTMIVTVSPLPQSVALLFAGLSNLNSGAGPLPLDLSPYGMNGCRLAVRPDVSALLVGSAGAASFARAVPAVSSLAGLLLHQQALVLDPLAGNAAGLVMSDAATALIGP